MLLPWQSNQGPLPYQSRNNFKNSDTEGVYDIGINN